MNAGVRPVMLVILDGFGWREETADNAVRLARTPVFTQLWQTCPHAFLRTSGRDVGLPDGQMGNSEVGHLNISTGRVVRQGWCGLAMRWPTARWPITERWAI